MKKLKPTINLLTVVIIALSLSFCGHKEEKQAEFIYPVGPVVKLKPVSNITGELSDNIQVVENEYKLEFRQEYNYYKPEIQLKLKFTKSKNIPKQDRVYLHATVTDETGLPISEIKLASFDWEKFSSLLKKGNNQEEWVSFGYNGEGQGIYFNTEDSLKIKFFFEKAKLANSISLSSEVSNVGNSSSSSKSSSANTAASVDCDKFIKEYEAFVNSYVKLLKKYKANPTDPSILSEYGEAAQKAMEMQSNAESCNDMKFAQKILELNTKLAQAAL